MLGSYPSLYDLYEEWSWGEVGFLLFEERSWEGDDRKLREYVP